MNFKKGVLAGFLVYALGCTHAKINKEPLPPDFLLGTEFKQITFFGDNTHPRFSPDSTKLIYQSSRPQNHKGSQIYEMDLVHNKERRVTFSDGDAFDPIYINDQEVMYASTTDEIKESLSVAPKDEQNTFPPADLYMSDSYGNEILRLTKQPGFDGNPLFVNHKEKPFIVFSSRRGDLLGLYRIDLENLPVSLISTEKDIAKDHPSIYQKGLKLAWVETNLKSREQRLKIMNLKNKMITDIKGNEGIYRDLFFAPRSPERIFYSILRYGEKQYQLEVYDVERKCTQVLFKGRDDLMSPAISDEPNERLAFARSFEDKRQIYIVPLPTNLGPCLEASAQATLKE